MVLIGRMQYPERGVDTWSIAVNVQVAFSATAIEPDIGGPEQQLEPAC